MSDAKALAKLDYNRPPADGATGLQKLAEPLLPQIRAAMPGVVAKNAERMVRCLLTECQRTPKLLDCSPRSLFGGVIQVAQLGLELGGPAGQSYLVPFGREAQLVIGYRGYITLAHRSRSVARVTPRVVREGDTFRVEYGLNQVLEHVPKFDDNQAAVGYYAVIQLVNAGSDFEYRTLAQAQAHRDRYALSKSGPWSNNFDEMAKKTCIRALAKRMPLSVEWVSAAVLDEMAEEGVSQQLSAAVVLDPEEKGEPGELKKRLEKAKAPPKNHTPGVDDPDFDPVAALDNTPDTPPKH